MKLLLIGMGPGNGRSIAKRFGREGFEILMIARNEDALREYSNELSAAGIKAGGYAVDITDEQAFVALIRRITAEHDDIEILHYNASAYNPAKPSELDLNVLYTAIKLI